MRWLLRLWTKNANRGNFEKVFESFQKSLKKIAKMNYLGICLIKFNKACVYFSRVRSGFSGKSRETFENFAWKFYWNFEFLFYDGKFVTKNRNFGNNTIFQQHFFRFRGGGTFHPSPWLRHGAEYLRISWRKQITICIVRQIPRYFQPRTSSDI